MSWMAGNNVSGIFASSIEDRKVFQQLASLGRNIINNNNKITFNFLLLTATARQNATTAMDSAYAPSSPLSLPVADKQCTRSPRHWLNGIPVEVIVEVLHQNNKELQTDRNVFSKLFS